MVSPREHWWLNHSPFSNENTSRPQWGLCSNPICNPENSKDVRRLSVYVCVGLFLGCIWQQWPSRMTLGNWLSRLLPGSSVINPRREERLLGSMCVFQHTCMHVCALKRGGVQVPLWWYLDPSFVRNPASLSQSVASWKRLGVPIWTRCVFWRCRKSKRAETL